MEVHLPDQNVVALNISRNFGESLFIMDPNSAPSSDFTTEPVYTARITYHSAHSPTLGPLVGWYGEGVLWTN